MMLDMDINTPIDIALDENKEVIYSGVCSKINSNICIMVNFNCETSEYEGFNIFRNYDVCCWRSWDEEELTGIKNNNLLFWLDQVNLDKMNTMYSALKVASRIGLIAFYRNKFDKDYYVGKLLSINRCYAKFKLVDIDGRWSRIKTIKINNIAYFSFATNYEKVLQHNL